MKIAIAQITTNPGCIKEVTKKSFGTCRRIPISHKFGG